MVGAFRKPAAPARATGSETSTSSGTDKVTIRLGYAGVIALYATAAIKGLYWLNAELMAFEADDVGEKLGASLAVALMPKWFEVLGAIGLALAAHALVRRSAT